MKSIRLILLIAISFVNANCSKHNFAAAKNNAFHFKGLLQKTGVTSYMYGTHTISAESKTYALKSTTINLDTYINQTITISGVKISGYPIENGPEYIDVKSVQ